MTSRLHFELFMRELHVRALAAGPRQLPLAGMLFEEKQDVGSVRLARIEAAIKETRADRVEE